MTALIVRIKAPSGPANFGGARNVNANKPAAVRTKLTAVIGAIRPVGTAPNNPGLRTNQASMPK